MDKKSESYMSGFRSNSVVRMDMKNLMSADVKISAISFTKTATEALLKEFTKGTVSFKHRTLCSPKRKRA